MGPRPEGKADGPPSAWTPNIDLFETPEAVGLRVDLPGVDPGNVDLSVSGNLLTIRGDKVAPPAGTARVHASERAVGLFYRQIPLPSEVDPEAIEAELQQGVLTVTMPKAPAARSHSIPIRPA